jgi:hypothetical protein
MDLLATAATPRSSQPLGSSAPPRRLPGPSPGATPTRSSKSQRTPVSSPNATEFFDETSDLLSGLGLFVVTFLAPIPGFLPAVALTILGVVILVVPILLIGLAAGALLLVGRLVFGVIVRATRALRSLVATDPNLEARTNRRSVGAVARRRLDAMKERASSRPGARGGMPRARTYPRDLEAHK